MNEPDPLVAAFCVHHGEADPEALVLRLCRELLAQAPTDRFPTPLEVLASWQGIRKIEHGVLQGPSMLFEYDGAFRVVLNDADPADRQRFSLAHEIVHIFFRCVPGAGLAHDSGEVEKLCDLGAAELTMPKSRFVALLQAAGLSMAGLRECSAEFATSLQACARRAMELTERPAAVIVADVSEASGSAPSAISDLHISSVYRSSGWSPAGDQLLTNPLQVKPVLEAFSNLDDRIGDAESHGDQPRYLWRVEAAGYQFDMENHRTRRVLALFVPSSA